jgi:hypothetical protein
MHAQPVWQAHGTKQGMYFDTETFEPLVTDSAFRAGLQMVRKLIALSAHFDGPRNWEGTLFDIKSGRCALGLIFPGSYKIVTRAFQDLHLNWMLGTFPLPGVAKVRSGTGLVDCDPSTCPFSEVVGKIGSTISINRAPFLARGGWHGIIRASASPTEQDVAYAFLSWCSQPAQSTTTITSVGILDSFRFSHLLAWQAWQAAGWNPESVSGLLRNTQYALSHPNAARDLSIPGVDEYYAAATPLVIAYAESSAASTDSVCSQLSAAWSALNKAGGADLHNSYRKSLGLPILSEEKTTIVGSLLIGIVVLGALGALLVTAVVLQRRKEARSLSKRRKTLHEQTVQLAADLRSSYKQAMGMLLISGSLELLDVISDWVAFVAIATSASLHDQIVPCALTSSYSPSPCLTLMPSLYPQCWLNRSTHLRSTFRPVPSCAVLCCPVLSEGMWPGPTAQCLHLQTAFSRRSRPPSRLRACVISVWTWPS